MRIPKALLCSLVSMSMSLGTAPPAMAQSFFQKLFGFGSAQPAPVARPAPQAIPPHRFYRSAPRHVERLTEDIVEDEIGPPDSGGPYKTMCVRACDGYYFPLRHNAWRKNFGPDAKSCRNACGDQGRLYYYPLNGGNPDMMVDLAGQPYKETKTAFGYRKKLVAGCSCKPAPWSFEEASRHRRYREQEAAALTQSHMETTGAGEQPGGPVSMASPEGPIGTVEKKEDPIQAAGRDEASAPAPEGLPVDASPQEPTSPERTAELAKPPHKRRRSRAPSDVVGKTAYQPAFGFSLFGASKPKYVWPGDAR